ncbi:tyrosine-type recombinase/integrase [Nonomuraea sp. NPDC050643]|uniref:tyrosine-type recombinase/integrase n=1 Tax=Nonomuraea sp. NPDC050643 TaxID=3155660 RepID=UPI0033E8C0FD
MERTEDWKLWKAILRQAGVRDVRVHDARHAAATLLIEQGVNIRVVQEVLGRTRVTTTERYTHVSTHSCGTPASAWPPRSGEIRSRCNQPCNSDAPDAGRPSPQDWGEGLLTCGGSGI